VTPAVEVRRLGRAAPLRPVLPVAIPAPYLTSLQLRLGLAWSVHAAAGTIVLAAGAGALLATLALPDDPPATLSA